MREPKITIDTVRVAARLANRPMVGLEDVRAAAELERISRRMRRLGEIQCNGIPRWQSTLDGRGGYFASWTEEDQEANDKAISKLEAKAHAIVDQYGVKIAFQRDPRGSAIRLGEHEYPL